MSLRVRRAVPEDVPVLHRFVVELAEVEEFPGPVTARPDDLAAALFGPQPVAEAVLAEVGGSPVGFALFYPTYSTVLGKPGLHLEDLYVREEYRGSGAGSALLAHVAGVAADAGCGRVEWWVLRTNESASRFYARLGARTVEEIEVLRLEGQRLREVADQR